MCLHPPYNRLFPGLAQIKTFLPDYSYIQALSAGLYICTEWWPSSSTIHHLHRFFLQLHEYYCWIIDVTIIPPHQISFIHMTELVCWWYGFPVNIVTQHHVNTICWSGVVFVPSIWGHSFFIFEKPSEYPRNDQIHKKMSTSLWHNQIAYIN